MFKCTKIKVQIEKSPNVCFVLKVEIDAGVSSFLDRAVLDMVVFYSIYKSSSPSQSNLLMTRQHIWRGKGLDGKCALEKFILSDIIYEFLLLKNI